MDLIATAEKSKSASIFGRKRKIIVKYRGKISYYSKKKGNTES